MKHWKLSYASTVYRTATRKIRNWKFRQRRLSESKGVAGKKGADKMNEKLPTIKGYCKDCYYL
jgi:hypothetical protein